MDIDLNADLGEGFGPWRMGDDEALLDVVSSANVACGFHAGDPLIMDRTVALALARGVDVGAHVGFPDRQGFGRRVMQIDPAELAAMVIYQLGALAGIARAAGAPHDAHELPRRARQHGRGRRTRWPRPLVRAVADFDPSLIDQSRRAAAPSRTPRPTAACASPPPSSPTAPTTTTACWCRASCRAPSSTTARRAGARPAAARRRHGRHLQRQARSRCAPQSILLHGDTPGAVTLARAVREVVEAQRWPDRAGVAPARTGRLAGSRT